MEIKQIFNKQIDRDIQGVIKAEQVENDIVQQDLDEYVVTNELQKHFNSFFSAYARSIDNKTDKIGVWISGFFGSGKSHFLKIISYLLENREINGRHAIDFFQDKIQDPIVLADMQRVANINTDVMLFNIDSKASSNSKSDKEAIMHVFMQVFNDMRGYYGPNLHVADLEEDLDKEGKLEAFKVAYQKADSKNEPWEKGRRSVVLKSKAVRSALIEVGKFDSENLADEWIKSTRAEYSLSIEDFANRINEYLNSKERNHHIAFLADEMGQYIGDSRDRMLNLQTVAEDLGRLTDGRAWVIVTAQEEIDSLAKADMMHMADFSKIQGRFDTRISMSSSNVDEVIKRRLLEKKPEVATNLTAIYASEGTSIDNMLHFNDDAERKVYKNADTFNEVYPFVPYQFNLVADVLRAIRDNSINGKHQSEGERSMIAMYQDAARMIEQEEVGKLVSFDMFYDPVDQFLDHMYASVIVKASQNEHINPNHEDNTFNVRVLKTLFLVKYVKNFKTNVENIVSLMIGNIRTERLTLEKEIKKALGILETENFIQKNLDTYEFLTDDEQDVNREINKKYVDPQEIQAEIGTRIFGSIIPVRHAYNLPQLGKAHNNRYVFSFINKVDDRIIGRSLQTEMDIQIVTKFNDINGIEENLRMESTGNSIIVDLPAQATFTEDLGRGKQIEMFINEAHAQKSSRSIETIITAKQAEKEAIYDDINLKIERALDEATIYMNGKPVENTKADFETRIGQAMDDLIKRVYGKLEHITAAKGPNDLAKALRKEKPVLELDVENTENELALDDLKTYIQLVGQVSLRNVKDKFALAPYGFIDDDINWLVGKLFMDGKLTVSINGEIMSSVAINDKLMFDYITKKQYQDKLLLMVREAVSARLKGSVNEVADNYWGRSINGEDEEIYQTFSRLAKDKINDWNKYRAFGTDYPGSNVLTQAIKVFSSIISLKDINEFFQYVDRELDSLLDIYEQEGLPEVESFFNGNNGQKAIWDRSLKLTREYEINAVYLQGDQEIATIYEQIKSLRNNIRPFNNIKNLKPLNDQLDEKFSTRLTVDQNQVVKEIESYRFSGLSYLEESGLVDSQVNKSEFLQKIDAAKQAVVDAGSLNTVHAEGERAKIAKQNFEDRIDTIARATVATKKVVDMTNEDQLKKVVVDPVPTVKTKIQKRRNAKQLVGIESSWTIKSTDDINDYLEKLRASLTAELEGTDVVHFEL